MGVRLIDDFLARNPNVTRCHDFRDTADVLAKVKKKQFLLSSKTIENCFFDLFFSKVLKLIWV